MDVTGDKPWTTFVEPTWSNQVTEDQVLLE
jgi:hypothetical protein